MTDALERLWEALAAPPATRVDRRVPKSKLTENAGLSAAERRAVEAGVERLTWRATLRPASIGVAAFSDESRDYPELVVMTALLRGGGKSARLAEIVHRTVSAPVVLMVGDGDRAALSIGLKRRHEREAGRSVVERFALSAALANEAEDALATAFLDSLNLSRLPAGDLAALHAALGERAEAFAAARATGSWRLPADEVEVERRSEALATLEPTRREVARLRKAVAAEKRLARRLELSHEVTRAEAELARTLQLLQ